MYRGKTTRPEATPASDTEHHQHLSVHPSPSSSSLASFASASRRLSSAGSETVKRVVVGLLPLDKVPAWYGENPYIRTGYRPVFAAAGPCFRSWTYLHNQSGNIYTHLVPGVVVATLGNAALAAYLSAHYPGATRTDRAVFHVYLTACAACFGLSAAYHTLLCHSRELADLWIRLDYVGISLLIMASFVPGLYMGFYCEPGLLTGYLGAIFVMGVFNSYLSFYGKNESKDWLTSRLLPFLALSLSAFIPIFHAVLLFPYDQLQKQSGLNYYYLEAVFMLIGVAFLVRLTRNSHDFPSAGCPGNSTFGDVPIKSSTVS
ncbi:Hly-III related protein [Cordyceps militaris CM01]|uniref:Hly-III related protein n=1 Tax=Cordyceps militaris (strain CM01) TaxID=983644 RepID=G3J4Y4_CORMM|nr:Hly-III related protein [Cordyceps militaris CM01]EGX96747.1 Hly-III related protein [Cordyceps militaris CM01]